MVELVDTQRSGRCARKGVRVRFPFSALDFVAVAPISISLGQYLLREDTQARSVAGVDRGNQSLRAGMGDVGVEAEGRGHAGVAKHRCYHVRRLAVLEREGGRGMPPIRNSRSGI